MMVRWKAALSGGCAVVAISAGALAQNPPQPLAVQPPAPSAGQAPLFDPQQLPTQRGQVQQFTLTPRGDIDGLILSDGTEVKTPPHLSTEIAYSIRPGDAVIIHGLRAASQPLVQAVSIADDPTGRMVVDNGPDRGRGRGARPAVPTGLAEIQGRVRMALHGPQGDVNGALLDDGTIVRLLPPQAYRFACLLQAGQTIVAEGTELVTAMGKVVDVQQIGPSREQLSLVEARPGPAPGRRPPPPPGFGPSGPPRP